MYYGICGSYLLKNYTNLKNLVKYGQIAMQLLQFNMCHFNVSNADTMSTKMIIEEFLML